MKKRLLAVVLAVCMIASACVLFASAAANGTYILYSDTEADQGKKISDIPSSRKGTKYEVAQKSGASINGSGSNIISISNDNINDVATLSPSGLTMGMNFNGTLTVSNGVASGTVNYALKTGWHLVRLNSEVDDDTKLSDLGGVSSDINGGAIDIDKVKVVNKLLTIETGVRLSGADGKNLVADEIAVVEATVIRGTNLPTTMVTDVINDLLPGDRVELKARLKHPEEDGEFYAFRCWVNGDNSVYSYSQDLPMFTVKENATLKAVFVEKVSRHRITFSASEGGKIDVTTNDITKREVFKGSGQISVLDGKDIEFTLTPDEEYQVGKVIITGEDGTSRNITSLVGLLTGETTWKELIRATLTDTLGTNGTIKSESLGTPTYTFKKVSQDWKIDVTFIKKAPLVAAEGKELPTIAAEGLTLMGAEEAVSEAEAAAAARGEAGGTTVPAENGAAGGKGAAAASGSVVNPATGSTTSAVGVFAALAVAAGAAVVTMKKKED